ncbi:MAG: PqqD family protein [Desulfuromonadales bacterium]|nr:PqqD family protein [Desulfuromonadales bacterium]
MSEEKSGMSRREFATATGASVALGALFAPNMLSAATSQEVSQHSGVDLVALEDKFLPLKAPESHMVFQKNAVLFFRNKGDLTINKYLKLNGPASMVVQLCNGEVTLEEIAIMISESYPISESEAKANVIKIVDYLYEQGYLCFVSNAYLTSHERKYNKGLILRETSAKTFNIKDHKNNNIIF